MKKIRLLRLVVQLIFLAMVFLRLHRQIAPALAILLPLAFAAGNFFCGWLCPLGTTQECLGRIGAHLVQRRLRPPVGIQRRAQYARYLLAAVLLLLVALHAIRPEDLNALPLDAYQSFFAIFDGHPLTAAATAFLALVLFLSLFLDRPFCNYICLNGIEYALPSWTRIFTVKRRGQTCIACKACDRSCPMHIEISGASEVRNLQCINCFSCLAACPVPKTLTYGKADLTLGKLKRWLGKLR